MILSKELLPQSAGQFNFEHVSIEQGLSQSSVNCILQDKNGFIWIGTADGLNRYDGYSFKVFRNNPLNTQSISDNGVTSIYEDKEGNLWVGTILGYLNKYNRKTEGFTRYLLSQDTSSSGANMGNLAEYPLTFSRYNSNSITTIFGDKEGSLWIGTWGKGLFKYNPRTNDYICYSHQEHNKNSLSSNRVLSILEDRNKNLWVGTFGGGLNKITRIFLTGKVKERLDYIHYVNVENDPNTLSDNRVISLIEDKDGFIWAGTFGGGLNKIALSYAHAFIPGENLQDVKITRYSRDNKIGHLSSNRIMKMIQDQSGQIWVATFGGGLNRFNPITQKFTVFKHDPLDPNSISDNDIISLFEDRTGIIWIGTHLGKGINRFDKSRDKFNHFCSIPHDPNSLSDNVIWSFAEDKEGFIWIGTYRGGLNRFDRKTKKFISFKHDPLNPNSISSNHIRTVFIDRNDRIWIGTYSSGLNLYDKRTGKFINFQHNSADPYSLSENQVLSIIEDKNGTIWIGTFGGGLNKLVYNNQTKHYSFEHYINIPNNPKSLSDNRIYKLFIDRKENFWVGTFGGGLSRFDPNSGSFQNYKYNPKDQSSLSENRVITIYEDKTDQLWVGTYGGGLNRFDPKTGKFTRYIQDGSPNSVIYGILEDANSYLWLSSDNGLSKLHIRDGHIVNYDMHDGLQSMEFSGGAYLKTHDGQMYFGGINGFNCFYPDIINENNHVPPVVISSFKIFNKEVEGQKDTIILESKHNFFTFEFSSLDFTNSEQNRYAYKLEGFDNDWHYTDASRRFASYTNLDPGKYIFRVRASNNDGIWNQRGIAVSIVILPPFYRTWWFILFAVIIVGGTIAYFVAGQIKYLLAIERLKGKLSADLHDSVGSGLTEISILSEVISSKLCDASDDIKEKLHTINETSGFLIDNMSDIVWVVNPNRDTLYDLILRLKDNYSDIFSSLGISFKVNNMELLRNIRLPMEHKQNLYLIFKEGINNCLKHSGCKSLLLDTKLHGQKLELALKDNGRGFNLKSVSLGNGLNNMKKRAKNIGGHLIIESSAENGTLIKFIGNIPRLSSFILKHTA
ncbi:MAG: two-component regulator propeller domain-containing protein [Bacteroidota bacterium]|nr:two-component regulator propeller domain-containing protein [Bacteroidota bacterium]MDP4193647.1 two-component regulator propeller domain-containing protein [Bacteroidota bacterium]